MKRIDELEKKYVLDVLDSQFSTSSGARYMSKLESTFAFKMGSRFAIAHVNGTATMHSALEAMDIGLGDEVIVPPLTMSSTSLAVLHANATPVFADINADTFVIDPQSVEKQVTKRTKAIIVVALYGLSPDMDAINHIAKKYGLYVIEDNAQAVLSYYKGRLLGTLSDCASFSFQSSKHLTSGEGGIVTTDSESLAVKIRKMSGLGYSTIGASKARITKEEIQHPSFLRHDALGWNYRMGELNCAVALAQVERMNELVFLRKRNAKFLLEAVDGCEWLTPQLIPHDCESSYWTFACKLDLNHISWENFRMKFLELGGDRFYGAWQLTYLEPLFIKKLFSIKRLAFIKSKEYNKGICPIAETLQPSLIQFKLDYLEPEDVAKQSKILSDTIKFFS